MKIKDKPICAHDYLDANPTAGSVTYVTQFSSKKNGPAAVYMINDALVVGKPTLILTPIGDILQESSSYRDYPVPLREYIKGPTVNDDNVQRYFENEYCLICGIWDDQFWHWMMDYIPKVVVAEASGFTGLYLIPKLTGFFRDSMVMLGIAQNRLVEYDGQLIRINSLWVVEAIEGFKGLPCYPSLVYKVRDQFLLSCQLNPDQEVSEMIYVARKVPYRPRKVVNEHELLQILNQYGFRKVFMEEFQLREQIGIASSARVLVGPHGAGMLHALFMPKNSLVIEFFSPYYILTGQVSTLSLLGHRYYSIVGTNGPFGPYQAGMDVDVDITLLEATLKREIGVHSLK